jgi:hypothetical protein
MLSKLRGFFLLVASPQKSEDQSGTKEKKKNHPAKRPDFPELEELYGTTSPVIIPALEADRFSSSFAFLLRRLFLDCPSLTFVK